MRILKIKGLKKRTTIGRRSREGEAEPGVRPSEPEDWEAGSAVSTGPTGQLGRVAWRREAGGAEVMMNDQGRWAEAGRGAKGSGRRRDGGVGVTGSNGF